MNLQLLQLTLQTDAGCSNTGLIVHCTAILEQHSHRLAMSIPKRICIGFNC